MQVGGSVLVAELVVVGGTELKMDVLEGIGLRMIVLERGGPKVWGAGPDKTKGEERRRKRMADKSILIVALALKYGRDQMNS